MAQEHHIKVARTARYYTLGELNEQTRHIWFALHGYGQLAQFFIRKFDVLDDGQTYVVAPEGLSRLYLDPQYSRIGASWMTREDRHNEISDTLNYLNTLYDAVLKEKNPEKLTINLLGFSQGCAAVCRWFNAGHIRCDRLLLWAGFFPNGLADVIDPAKLVGVDTAYVYGTRDEYIEQMDDADGYLNRLKQEVPALQVIAYDGTHSVDREVLSRLAKPSDR
ncbi:esterase [Nibrella saemangeumensis]|uniref:Esterase n=1 Tax=Nibrella saemangeumensis TaxID=1084526 RepID=A0ABP8MKD3_9BACT